MTVHPIASGSAGNAILLREGKRSLLLDCGVPWSRVQEATGFSASLIDAVLVTHEHGDHCRGVGDARAAGRSVYCSAGTAKALGIEGFASIHILDPLLARHANCGWQIMALPVTHHGAEEPVAFMVRSPAGELAAYICDAPSMHHRMVGVTHWLVEANYDQALVPASLDDRQREHIEQGHMSIEQTIELLRANDLSAARGIWLLHLSDRHSDAADFQRRVMAVTGVPTFVAPARTTGRV